MIWWVSMRMFCTSCWSLPKLWILKIIGDKKSFILYGCKYVTYGEYFETKRYFESKIKPRFNAVYTKQVFIFVSLDSYDSKIQSLSCLFSNSHSAVCTLQLTYFQSVLQRQTFDRFSIQILSCSLSPTY
jgi:hypothetical protein